MSDYDKRYNVHANMVSHYTDDPIQAVRLLDTDPEHGWVEEGYGDHKDMRDGRTMVTRRTTGRVTRQTLMVRILLDEYEAQRAEVQRMIRDIQACADAKQGIPS
jgi:hypothetical protein